MFCVSKHSPSPLFSLLSFLIVASSFFSSSLVIALVVEEGFEIKSTGNWGVLCKPKARRRSIGLLRRAVIILVTCYRRACSSVYLQLLLPLGTHFNAWGWLLCNELRNTGSRCKKRRETREARNHLPKTNRSAKNQVWTENHGHWKCRPKKVCLPPKTEFSSSKWQ